MTRVQVFWLTRRGEGGVCPGGGSPVGQSHGLSQGTVENLQALLTYVASTPCQPLGWWAESSCLLALPGSSPEMETLNTVLTLAFPPSSCKAIVFTP